MRARRREGRPAVDTGQVRRARRAPGEAFPGTPVEVGNTTHSPLSCSGPGVGGFPDGTGTITVKAAG